MDKFQALRTAVRIVELLEQLPREHCLPVHCDSAEEARLLVSFIRGTDKTGRFQSTGSGKFRWFEASGDEVYDDLNTVFIRSCALRPLCGWCETLNTLHSVTCEVCDEPLA